MASAGRRAGSARPSRARVFLVDDHPIVREGLARLIEQAADLAVSGTAASSSEALRQIQATPPDIAVVDVSLEGSHGLDLVRDLHLRHPDLPVLVLSVHDEMLYAERALHAGARGYLTKREPPAALLQAIRRILRGGMSYSEAVTSRVMLGAARGRSREAPTSLESLSDRELQVLELIGRGRATRQIADELHLSIKTVQAHREHIKEKLQIEGAASLARFAVHWLARQES